jgi:hypothetical protein
VGPHSRIEDNFPDEDLFHLEGEDSLYFDIVQFLKTGLYLGDLSSEEKSLFNYKVGPYTLIQGTFYQLSLDLKLKRCLET